MKKGTEKFFADCAKSRLLDPGFYPAEVNPIEHNEMLKMESSVETDMKMQWPLVVIPGKEVKNHEITMVHMTPVDNFQERVDAEFSELERSIEKMFS